MVLFNTILLRGRTPKIYSSETLLNCFIRKIERLYQISKGFFPRRRKLFKDKLLEMFVEDFLYLSMGILYLNEEKYAKRSFKREGMILSKKSLISIKNYRKMRASHITILLMLIQRLIFFSVDLWQYGGITPDGFYQIIKVNSVFNPQQIQKFYSKKNVF